MQENSSTFIRHAPCENCGSQDNLAIYLNSDESQGHTYCFGCHDYNKTHGELPEVATKRETKNMISGIIEALPKCKIILYNFEKLCGYKFSISCVNELVKKFPAQIVGLKDSSYNLYEILKIDNFSIFPGSELKLLKGLEIGCAGIITATCNVTASISRKVYDDYVQKKSQTSNDFLCNIRTIFDQFNLISGLHSFMSNEDDIYKNVLPPLSLLNEKQKKKLIEDLSKINFTLESLKAA